MTALLVALVVIPGTVGDLLNSAGMKRQGPIIEWRPRALVRFAAAALRNPYVLIGLPNMAISFFALMGLLSRTTISFAVPITASSYILETGLAKYVLKERVDWQRWLGAILVASGVILLAL